MTSIDPTYVSCGLKSIYDLKNFPGPVSEFDNLRLKPSAAIYVCQLFPAFEYCRTIDLSRLDCSPGFAAAMARSRTLVNQGATGPASVLFLLPSVIVRDRVIYLDQKEDFPVVYETHRPIDRANSSLAALDELRAAERDSSVAGPAFFLGSTGCFNYGHWLVDDLTRLEAFWKIRERHPDELITVIVTAHGTSIDAIKKESIEFLLSKDNNFVVKSYARPAAIAFENLYFASPTTVHSTLKSPEALSGLRNSAVQSLKKFQNGSRLNDQFLQEKKGLRIFVNRDSSRSRSLKNGAEIFSILEKIGFKHYTLENSSFLEQAAIFTEASIVIGNMGAGMTNTLFCSNKMPILNLAPEGWDEPFFWDLAAVGGQRHTVLYGQVEGETFESGFNVDPEKILAWIDEAALQRTAELL